LADAKVEVWFSNGYVATVKTSSYGVAHLDLATVPPSPGFAAYPKARIKLAGANGRPSRDLGELVFRGSSLHRRSVLAEQRMRALAPDPAPPSSPASLARSAD
jgi:hypothetical protein